VFRVLAGRVPASAHSGAALGAVVTPKPTVEPLLSSLSALPSVDPAGGRLLVEHNIDETGGV